jgi:hypothetical protein
MKIRGKIAPLQLVSRHFTKATAQAARGDEHSFVIDMPAFARFKRIWRLIIRCYKHCFVSDLVMKFMIVVRFHIERMVSIFPAARLCSPSLGSFL